MMRIGIVIASCAALLATAVVTAQTGGKARQMTWQDIVPEGAEVEKVAGGFQFVEGPIWTKKGTLLFSDIPADSIFEWKGSGAPAVFRKPSRNANGNTLDRQGRLVSCEHSGRQVTRTEKDGKLTVLATTYDGKRLNSPNDAVVKNNGDIYFTDPPYGIKPEQEELGFYGVYRLKPASGELTLLTKEMRRPNGIALSPDGKRLYVADSERGHMMAFDVQADGTVKNGRVFADMRGEKPGVPDGMRVDVHGNIYCTGSGGIQVFAPSGERLGTIAVPEVAANCGWGDADAKTLYITASNSLYRIRLKVKGLRP